LRELIYILDISKRKVKHLDCEGDSVLLIRFSSIGI
jgi:hypothetical protein